jgi:hypothetical protein
MQQFGDVKTEITNLGRGAGQAATIVEDLGKAAVGGWSEHADCCGGSSLAGDRLNGEWFPAPASLRSSWAITIAGRLVAVDERCHAVGSSRPRGTVT